MPILQLAVPCPLRRSFDYLPPEGTDTTVMRPGMRVLAPFGNRRVVAVLLAVRDSSRVDSRKLKRAVTVLDREPALTDDILALCQWAARYYQHPIGDCVQQALPARLRREKPAREDPAPGWRVTARGRDTEPDTLGNAPRQQQLLALLQHQTVVGRAELREQGLNPAIAHALCEKGLLEPFSGEPPPNGEAGRAVPPTLHPEQQHAVSEIDRQSGRFGAFLLEGVTGSGKTEVYLRLIDACLQRRRQALVLIPEIGLTPQTLNRFRGRFGEQVAVLHSGLADGERLRGWERARSGDARIVLGTRSAVFTPFAALGLIVVDEEHDLSYKQQDGFRYSARDLAVKRAADNDCPVILGSATPSLESLYNSARGRYHHLTLRQRAGGASAPSVALLDIRDHPVHHGLSDAALGKLGETLASGNQALVFLNRRGFAPVLQCHSCGWLADCRHCDSRLTVHVGRRQLRCHHCDAVEPLPDRCPQCENRQLEYRGPGTERLEMALREQFPAYPVLRLDRDTTAGKGAMHAAVEQVRGGEPCLLVGTQMLAKGHHFPDVTTVIIVDIDNGLFSADYRGAERVGQLLVQVAGRAGRADKPGQVLVQTHCPDHPVLQTLVHDGYPAFARQLLSERRLMGLPPYAFTALIRADATSLQAADEFLRPLRGVVDEAPGCQGIGPLPAPMTRKAGRYRCVLLLQADRRRDLHAALQQLCSVAEQQRGSHGLRWSVDVDPVDMY